MVADHDELEKVLCVKGTEESSSAFPGVCVRGGGSGAIVGGEN